MDTMAIVLSLFKGGQELTIEELMACCGISGRYTKDLINRLKEYGAKIEKSPEKGYRMINVEEYSYVFKKVIGRKRKEKTRIDNTKRLTAVIDYENIKNIMLCKNGMEIEREEAIRIIKRAVGSKGFSEEIEIRKLYKKWRKEVLTS